jgi:sulfur carrier protein
VVRVNGRDEVEWQPGLTVARLLERLRFTFPRVIVTVNGEAVAREEYAMRVIPDDADVRVIHLMAGG